MDQTLIVPLCERMCERSCFNQASFAQPVLRLAVGVADWSRRHMLPLTLLKRFDIKECVNVDQAQIRLSSQCKLKNLSKVCAQISYFYQVLSLPL